MDQAVENRIKSVLSQVFEIEEEDISDGVGPDSVALWDSLNHLNMITALERTFQIKLTMKEIRSMVTFGKIKEVLDTHLS